MKIKFADYLSLEDSLKAVERNGDALRYVLSPAMFVKIAMALNIEIEMSQESAEIANAK